MKTQINQKWYAAFYTHCKYVRFESYEKAWRFAEQVYNNTGKVVAIEAVN